MPRSRGECDVLVIGGGPAGATAAQLLASWGHAVTLLHRPAPARLTLAESLPPSTRKLLAFLGQLDSVEAAGLYANHGTIVDWAGASHTTTSRDAGFHVSRAAFDDLLRGAARAAGVRIVHGTVRRVDAGDPFRVVYAASGGRTLRARFVCDCSGRAGVIARRGLRIRRASYRTLAIVAEWTCDEWPAPESLHTTIESYPNGWAWSVPLSATRRQCTVMIDPRTRIGTFPAAEDAEGAEPRRFSPVRSATTRSSLTALYESELAKALALSARLKKARRTTAPWSCDASIYDSRRAADGHALLVGDAASFIEPLSSAGVKKALVSAWRAAVVINTCATNSAMTHAATDLYVRRERDVFADCVRRSSAFFADAASAYGTLFWKLRAAAREEEPSPDDDGEIDDAALASDEHVRAAFERLRAASRVRLRPADALRFRPMPVIDGREVVMRDGLVTPGGAALQFAAGVQLAPLARIAASCDEVPAIIAEYQHTVGPAAVEGLLTGLSLLVARHALIAEDSPS